MKVQKYTHIVIGIIENEHKQYFVQQRQAGTPMPFVFEFPGGKVEKNESNYDALARELKEEVLIDITDAKIIANIKHQYTHANVDMLIYLVKKYSGEPKSPTGQWLTLKEIAKLEMPDANEQILKALNHFIKNS